VKIGDGEAASIVTAGDDGYIRFEMTAGVPVTVTFLVRPRLENRRFGVPALDPSKISRHSKIVLTRGPALLMANADNPPVVVVAVGPDGKLDLPRSADGVHSLVTVASLEADEKQIAEAIRSDSRLKVGPWSTTGHETPMAFVFDAIAVPSDSALGQAVLAGHNEHRQSARQAR